MGWPYLKVAGSLLSSQVHRQTHCCDFTAPTLSEAWHKAQEGQAGEEQPLEGQARLCGGVPAKAGPAG